jgi:ABC-type polysaccharide/polyol phosphate export permease
VTSNLAALLRSKDLLYMLTWRDIRVRYKQSIMGFFWAILMPAVVVGAGILVRFAAAQWSGTPLKKSDIGSVMVRAVVWSFIISGIRFGTNSLITNPNLVTKLAFPKEVFPISAVLSNLFDFSIAFTAVLIIMLIFGWIPTAYALLALPLMLLVCAFTTGLSLLLAAANLFFRDVKYLVEVLLTYAIFFTPVLYDASALGRWKVVVLLNPAAPLLEGLADVLVYGRMPELIWLAYSSAASLLLLIVSYWFFKQLEPKFAESL